MMADSTLPKVTFQTDLDGVDWVELKASLAVDRFDNGRSPDQLRRCFENSYACVFARAGDRVVGKGRALSDGVSNAYIIDVWTLSEFRDRGIGRKIVKLLLNRLKGQHVYLFTDDRVDFYKQLGFREQPVGLSRTIGKWLKS
jgi:ribosomal protein S18 acetylase RimI-like enzyme